MASDNLNYLLCFCFFFFFFFLAAVNTMSPCVSSSGIAFIFSNRSLFDAPSICVASSSLLGPGREVVISGALAAGLSGTLLLLSLCKKNETDKNLRESKKHKGNDRIVYWQTMHLFANCLISVSS